MSLWDLVTRARQDVIEFAKRQIQFQLSDEPVPHEWYDILTRNVPLASSLSDTERDRLLRVARVLLDEVPFEGCDGLGVTDEIRVTIAATAALLIQRFPYPRFTKLVRILVYPDTFIPRKVETRHDSFVIEDDATLGQAWKDGVVILAWEDIRRDAQDRMSQGSVILHEMAHVLDAEDGIFDGVPLLDRASQIAEWEGVLTREFARQARAVTESDDPPLRPYAATDRAEFFAVATEAFFCYPDRLRQRLPDLYRQMERFFRPSPGEANTAHA